MVAAALQDPFHRRLRNTLLEHRDARIEQLIKGGAAKSETDTATTAEKYAAQVSYIEAVNLVLDLCMSIEEERYGNTPAEER